MGDRCPTFPVCNAAVGFVPIVPRSVAGLRGSVPSPHLLALANSSRSFSFITEFPNIAAGKLVGIGGMVPVSATVSAKLPFDAVLEVVVVMLGMGYR